MENASTVHPEWIGPALNRAASLLVDHPDLALDQVEDVLRRAGPLPPAELLACQALRRLERREEALTRLDVMARSHPPAPPPVWWELAGCASELGRSEQSVAALQRLTHMLPKVADGWFLLARELRNLGRKNDAWRADLSGVHASSADPALIEAAIAMNEDRFAESEQLLHARISQSPANPAAIRLLAEVRWRQGDMSDALELAERAVELAPGFDLARDFLIRLLLQLNRLTEALEQAEHLLASPVKSPGHDLIMASVLLRLGKQEEAGAIYRKLLAKTPEQPQLWQNLGHVLKTMGKQGEAIDAYRRATALRPTMGEAWWSLANLKTVKLGASDIDAMKQALAALAADGNASLEDVFHLHFSLGKALEDAKDFDGSFNHYAEGNRLRRAMIRYDADAFSAEAANTARCFTANFIAQRGEGGCPAADPIFIVGLPRSGSTLVEQILSSHSLVEGTMELPEMMMIAGRLQSRIDEGDFPDFRALIESLTPADRRRLGDEYIERTRIHRLTDRPYFIDKMPNNWQHVGLIRLILPNAHIIDARRHPMACCFSAWKQHFARGQAFSYDLADVARYYRDYVALMAAYDEAAPVSVHRVHYERMVADTETEVRRMLAYLGLEFEQSCLEFYKNERSVRTASSEQVRQPIFSDGVDQWKNFEAWLGPLSAALGATLQHYPEVRPEF